MADRDYLLDRASAVLSELHGARLFITGGTGFFGCWLLESLTWALDHLAVDVQAHVLTRSPERFGERAPHLAEHRAIRLVRGDVRGFAPPGGAFSHVIHAATEASDALNREQPLLMYETIVAGTEQVLKLAAEAGAERLLLTSSGAVYGRQPSDLTHVGEDYLGAPDPLAPGSAYGEGKRVSEFLCATWGQQHHRAAVIARCYAFVGPHLPLDLHFAIGNFIRDGLAGGPLRISGDGTPYRSYLYAADLAIWLWTLLVRGEGGRAYNVGAEEAVSIRETAEVVAACFAPRPEVTVAQTPDPARPPSRYVPSTRRAREELGLAEGLGLADAVRRTIAWHRAD